MAPDVPSGSTPTGLTVDVHVPQEAALNLQGLAESTLRDTTVTLPAGVALNPAGADGLQACSEAQIGFTGVPESEEESEKTCSQRCSRTVLSQRVKDRDGEDQDAAAAATRWKARCIWRRRIANPFGSLVAMYIVAQDPVSGVLREASG